MRKAPKKESVLKSNNKCTQWFLLFFLVPFLYDCEEGKTDASENDTTIHVSTEDFDMNIEKEGFRYEFRNKDGGLIAPAHTLSGLQIKKSGNHYLKVSTTTISRNSLGVLELDLVLSNGSLALVTLKSMENGLKISVAPKEVGEYEIVLRTSPVGSAYGMGDHAAFGEGSENLELENFVQDPFDPERRSNHRMISNFAIFPKQGMAEVNMEPGAKVVRITNTENAQGSKNVAKMPTFYYFFGSPPQIYDAYLNARNKEGYPVYKPKYAWFGVGWEAFGALAWNTDHKTVTDNINTYLTYGYPLKWMVVGSGFWPSTAVEFDKNGNPNNKIHQVGEAKKLQSTTSFGMWDEKKYPDPKKFIDYFHQKGLIFTIGLRIGFVPGGPFTDEGLEKGYFLKNEKGWDILDDPGFPTVPVYYLDTKKPKAVDWYIGLCQKWLEFGVDGFKEDLYAFSSSVLRDDFIDLINQKLMDKGVYLMGRNNYLGSPVDIHRYNDFNYDQSQDRGPINGLAYAFSGFSNVYPDIVGGTGLASHGSGKDEEKKKKYLIRYAQYAAFNPSMSFGYGPWNYGDKVNDLCLEAANLHARLHPYFYSNAIKAYRTGFPHTMVPLPLAFPKDSNVYGLANTSRRGYEWMIGDALLAAPLYGDDYEKATSRDIYLPEGTWIDYDTGQEYQGPVTLENFEVPLEKAPLFVGGTGIVIEEISKGLKARIYPVKNRSETVFYGKDGELKSTITIDGPDWDNPKITDITNGDELEFTRVRHAYQFNFKEGHNYLIN